MAKVGKLIPTIAGAIIGGVVGGPAGAAAGASIGAGLTATHTAGKAATRAKEEGVKQTEAIRGQTLKAEKFAKQQLMQSEKALRKISEGRVRAASRRVRGGLFGDSGGTQQQYGEAAKLGG